MTHLKVEEAAEIADTAKDNLVDFRSICLGVGPNDVEPAPFHFTWSDMLLNEKDHCAIEGYRESAKSQYVLRSFLAYCLAYPSKERDYIVIIKANATLAGNKLKELEYEHETNPLLKSNTVQVRVNSSEVFSVDCIDEHGETINVRIEAYGKGASIRGLSNIDRRPKIVIVDDPQDIEDAESPTVSENDWRWFLSDVIFLGQHTRIFLIGNNLGERCIIERVFATEGKMESVRFKTMRVAELTDDGRSAWPTKKSVEKILAEKEDYRRMGQLNIWLREKMCQAVGEETRIFNPDDYRYFTPSTVHTLIEGSNRYAVLDPASSTEKSSCYRAIVVAAVNADNYWHIVDVPFGRWDSSEMIERIFDTVVKWDLKTFGIEKGHFKQIIEPFIYKEMSRRNTFFNIVPIEHGKVGSKLERIKMLQPRFKAHTIWFPEEAPWLAEMESELAGVTNDAIKSLFCDLIDALAMVEQIAQRPAGRRNRSLSPEMRQVAPEVALI